MGLFGQFFGHKRTEPDLWAGYFEHLVANYRHHGAVHRCAPDATVTDAEIVQIYKKVEVVFQAIARERGSLLHLEVLQNITLFFLQKFQMIGKAEPTLFAEHITYEAEKYRREGLRSEYNRPLSLLWSEPLWHKQIPPELKYTDTVLWCRLELLRREVGLDDDMFLMAIMTSRNTTTRSVVLAYRCAKRTIPNLTEIEYLTLTIGDRVNKKLAALPYNYSPTLWTAEQLNGARLG